MAKNMTSKQNELLKKQKAHEATLEKIKALQAQSDEEVAAINNLEKEIASLRQAEQEKQLNSMAFGQTYNGDEFEKIMPELAILFNPKTKAAALEALAAVRARVESDTNSNREADYDNAEIST